jgi:hypothetical protein
LTKGLTTERNVRPAAAESVPVTGKVPFARSLKRDRSRDRRRGWFRFAPIDSS